MNPEKSMFNILSGFALREGRTALQLEQHAAACIVGKESAPAHVVIVAVALTQLHLARFLFPTLSQSFWLPFSSLPVTSCDIMNLNRLSASLLDNPDPQQVQVNQEGDKVSPNIVQQQAAQEEKRKQRRLEFVRRMRRKYIPRPQPPAARANRLPPNETSEGHEVAPRKVSMKEFVQSITPSRIYGRKDLGPVPLIIMPNPEDDVFFLEDSERKGVPIRSYRSRRKMLEMRHYLMSHPDEVFFRGDRLFAKNGRVEVILPPQVEEGPFD